jgi:hypothetical protein
MAKLCYFCCVCFAQEKNENHFAKAAIMSACICMFSSQHHSNPWKIEKLMENNGKKE